MKKIVLMIMIMISLNMYGEKVKIYTSAGEVMMELEVEQPEKKVEVRSVDRKQKIELQQEEVNNDKILLYNLLKKLNKLEVENISTLDADKYEKAKMLLGDIRFILEALHSDEQETFEKVPPEKKKEFGKVIKAETLSDEDFDFMVERVEKESFDKEKISTLKIVMKKNAKITLEQCIKMIKLFPFDESRLTALEYMYPKILEKKNTYVLVDYFDFISTKDRVKKLIAEKK